MRRLDKLLACAALLAAFLPAAAGAQVPLAGTGQMQPVDPAARPSRAVTDAVEKIMSNRDDRAPFLRIRRCFEEAGARQGMLLVCRQRMESYHRFLDRERRDILGGLPVLEVHARLLDLARDPGAGVFMGDVFALRGILTTLEDARDFRDIKACFRDAGPQPALRQICGQRLDRFYDERALTLTDAMRDVKPDLIRRRLRERADAEGAGIVAGDTNAFESLRNIREAQQNKREAARRAIAAAQPYYCTASPGKYAAPLESRMSEEGICLCAYGRRYLASGAVQPGRPVRAAYGQCGVAGRFRIGDLNRGRLAHGDWVTLRAAHGGYLSMDASGHVTADKNDTGRFESFRVLRASGLAGVVRPGEMVALVSPRGFYVIPDFARGGTLRGSKGTLKPHEYFVLLPE